MRLKNKLIWLILSFLITLTLMLVACGTKTVQTTTVHTTVTSTTVETTVLTKPTTTTTTTAEKPLYGGTFTYRDKSDPTFFDPYRRQTTGGLLPLIYEAIGTVNLSIERQTWDFKVGWVPPNCQTGALAESWEVAPDFKSYIFNIRKGIRWQDKAPVNGRELTAYDIEYTFHRQLGLGSGFTKGSQYIAQSNFTQIESVTATDKYTVMFKLKEPSLQLLNFLIGNDTYNMIVAREAVEKWGNLDDWRNEIGTGPFMMTDYVSGSSVTFARNQNYWGYDELYPQNRLPYFEQVKMLIIGDDATAFAGIRTGKIDLIEDVSWQQAKSLVQTNPELVQTTRPQTGWCILMHVDTKPFDDIRVRKAMQMAIDIPTISKTYYGGNAVTTPIGLCGLKGYYTPFEQWPKDVQEWYTYNPTGAKKLLAEAGYPSGFKFTLTASVIHDMDLYQILKAYLQDVGINMEIQVMDNTAWSAYTNADKHVAMSSQLGTIVIYPPMNIVQNNYSKQNPYRHHINDPKYDEIYFRAKASLNDEEFRKIVIEADAYATAQQWRVTLPPYYNYVMWQPWLKRYSGEKPSMQGLTSAIMPRLWIDQNLKKAVGH